MFRSIRLIECSNDDTFLYANPEDIFYIQAVASSFKNKQTKKSELGEKYAQINQK